jgi:UDP-N-acetylglucosamine--dolichyl-phosphate N-acetylglucosaminephosphotransferase
MSNLQFQPFDNLWLVLIFICGFLSSYLTIPKIINFMKENGYVGKDIHKNHQPEVPESGGLSTVIGFLISSLLIIVFFPEYMNEVIIFIFTISIAAIIGFVDDRIKLKSRYKIFLTLIAGLPLFFANIIDFIKISSPIIPFLGRTRLTIIYPFLVPIIVGMFTNTVNMLEGYNGEGSGSCLIALIFILLSGIILFSKEVIIFTLPVIAAIIPFFFYNKYPAKIFPGDIGTLSWGAAIAFIALVGSIEFPVFCVLLIHIFNSFYVIFSLRGFIESSDLDREAKDIILMKNNTIRASERKDAALTIPRLILAKGLLNEKKLVNNIWILSLICGIFSLFASFLIKWSMGQLTLIHLIVLVLIFGVLISLILQKYYRIRGIVYLMILLLVVGLIFLFLIDTFVMPVFTEIIDLYFLKIPVNLLVSLGISIPGLLIWYYITIKYFWYEIEQIK